MSHEAIDKAIAEFGLTVESEFVPFSHSRNKNEKHPSLNWRVTLKTKGRVILTTDYFAGSGHCPSYKNPPAVGSKLQHELIQWECEHGRRGRVFGGGAIASAPGSPRIAPETRDVIYSLVMDADVLEHSGFEDWASSFGYGTNSRSSEATYRACLDIALKLRKGIGEAGIAALREAFQGY
jgi:hypothetical protein